jgi:uncharacterized NAD(P)/FAD-binding protein YdhS
MKRAISIVGGGAAAISFLHSYLQLIKRHSHLPKVVYLFEGRRSPGTGAAYEADLETNLLNTKAGSVSPFCDGAGGFLGWLHEKRHVWSQRYGSISFDEHTYMPRPVFGMYLQHCLDDLVKQAAVLHVEVVQINAEVTDARRSRHGYILNAGHGLVLSTDYVFLCCGTLPAKMPAYLRGADRVLPTPYPITALERKIPKDASVGVLGGRLSCIDTVIGLIERGHTGKVTIHSRSGYFPSVRGTQGRVKPKLLRAEHLDKLPRRGLSGLVDLIIEETTLIGGKKVDFMIPPPPADQASFLRAEIAKSASERIWQAVLYATNGVIEKLWSHLDDDGKTHFMNQYFSAFMAYRVSIPVENARKILAYLESGQLHFHAGGFDISIGDAGEPSVVMQKGVPRSFVYDYLIDATGSPRDVRKMDSPLLEALLDHGIVTPQMYGGIKVDPESYRIINRDGNVDLHMYALGELTNGTFFFTSALEIIARHARLCATRFAEGDVVADRESMTVSSA